jgi:TrmH family RNA methyltransferase
VQINQIHSTANSLVKKARALASGASANLPDLFLIEGRKLIEEAYLKNVPIVAVIASRSFLEAGKLPHLDQLNELNIVNDENFKHLHSTTSSCGIVALAKKQEYNLDAFLLNQSKQSLVLLERIQDPGNLGTMIRTAQAFNTGAIILSKGTVDHFSPKVVRASMGAVFNFPIISDQDIEACLVKLKSAAIDIIALDGKVDRPFWLEKFPQSTAYLFGNEGSGLSSLALSQADKIVNIPLSSQTESLNVAVAMGIVLCHANNAKIQLSK